MAARIEVEKLKECEFRVRVIEDGRKSTHGVTLTQDDYRRLGGGQIEPHELIRRSFEFATPTRAKSARVEDPGSCWRASRKNPFCLHPSARDFFTARVLALERRALGSHLASVRLC